MVAMGLYRAANGHAPDARLKPHAGPMVHAHWA